MRPSFMVSEGTKATPTTVDENGASDKPLLTIVVPLFNEHEVFSALQTRLLEVQAQLGTEYRLQIVLVDDGSSDNTWPLVKGFADQHSFVKGVSLSSIPSGLRKSPSASKPVLTRRPVNHVWEFS